LLSSVRGDTAGDTCAAGPFCIFCSAGTSAWAVAEAENAGNANDAAAAALAEGLDELDDELLLDDELDVEELEELLLLGKFAGGTDEQTEVVSPGPLKNNALQSLTAPPPFVEPDKSCGAGNATVEAGGSRGGLTIPAT